MPLCEINLRQTSASPGVSTVGVFSLRVGLCKSFIEN